MCALSVVIIVVLACAARVPAQSPTLTDVLARAAEYAATYSRTIAVIVADEKAEEVLRGFGVQSSDSPGMEVAGHTEVRIMRGAVAIESRGNEKGWQVYRDIQEVNNRAQHPKNNRLEELFRDTVSTAATELAAIVEASRKWRVGSVPRIFDVPTFSLMFLMQPNQARFTFKKTGEKKVDGESVWVVSYDETKTPTLVVTNLGEEYPLHGELWIEPVSGRVVKSKMIAENVKPVDGTRSGTEAFRPRITVDVVYQKDNALNVWVPVEMKQLYVKAVEQVTCTAKYSNVRVIASKTEK
jgi:hypothetical protein